VGAVGLLQVENLTAASIPEAQRNHNNLSQVYLSEDQDIVSHHKKISWSRKTAGAVTLLTSLPFKLRIYCLFN